MTKKLQNYVTTIVGTLVTIILSMVSDFILKLPTEITWITFSAGAMITIAVTLLERRLLDANSEEINHKLEIFKLLATIEDNELQKRGHSALEECRDELENLSKGILRIESPELFQYHIKTSAIAQKQILGTHIGIKSWRKGLYGDSSIEAQTSGELQWYDCKLKLIRQGVHVERTYILSRETSVETETGHIYPEIRKYLEKQQIDGISIYIVWLEDIDKSDLIQDISIFDDKVAIVIHPTWTAGFSEITVLKKKFDVDRYTNLYYAIRAKGLPFQEVDIS